MNMAEQHPFSQLSYEDRLKFWDDIADTYSMYMQGDVPRQVVSRLFNLGMMESDDCVLEVGSGPGTYSLEIANKVRILTCMDTSQKMLDRLMRNAKERGLTNIERFHQDWSTYKPRKGYDVCIATLCPGVGSPESLVRMEGAARRSCVSVAWIRNHGDDMNAEIWKRMGKDYGYTHRASTATQDWLKENGRDPVVERFETRIVKEFPAEEVVAKEADTFEKYGLRDEAEKVAREIVDEIAEDGVVRYDYVNELKMTAWKSR